MLEKVLSVAGKPGLYRLISRGNNALIVESIDAQKRRMPIFASDKVIGLDNIAMYTDDEEVPLANVFQNIKTKENGAHCGVDYKTASKDELFAFLGEVLPNYDGDRIYPTDVKKLIQWYNILVDNGMDDFSRVDEQPSEELNTPAAAPVANATAAKKAAAKKAAPKASEKKGATMKTANRKTSNG